MVVGNAGDVGVAGDYQGGLEPIAYVVVLVAIGTDGLARLLVLFRCETAQLVIGVGLYPACSVAQSLGCYPPIAQIVQGVVHTEDGTAVFGVGYSGQAAGVVVAILSRHAIGVAYLV